MAKYLASIFGTEKDKSVLAGPGTVLATPPQAPVQSGQAAPGGAPPSLVRFPDAPLFRPRCPSLGPLADPSFPPHLPHLRPSCQYRSPQKAARQRPDPTARAGAGAGATPPRSPPAGRREPRSGGAGGGGGDIKDLNVSTRERLGGGCFSPAPLLFRRVPQGVTDAAVPELSAGFFEERGAGPGGDAGALPHARACPPQEVCTELQESAGGPGDGRRR